MHVPSLVVVGCCSTAQVILLDGDASKVKRKTRAAASSRAGKGSPAAIRAAKGKSTKPVK